MKDKVSQMDYPDLVRRCPPPSQIKPISCSPEPLTSLQFNKNQDFVRIFGRDSLDSWIYRLCLRHPSPVDVFLGDGHCIHG